MNLQKKFFVSLVAITSLGSNSAYAADGSSGCGVGWYIFKENSLVSSYSRSITNTFLGNTFSMTSGTSNCAKHSIVYNEKRGLHFVESNADSLEIAIASGEGQFLQGFAESMGCPNTVTEEFATTLQSGYTQIYSSHEVNGWVDTAGLYNKIRSVLNQNSVLRNQCKLVGKNS